MIRDYLPYLDSWLNRWGYKALQHEIDPDGPQQPDFPINLIAGTGPQAGAATSATVTVSAPTATAQATISAQAAAATVNVTPGTATGQATITAAATAAQVNVTPGAATGVQTGASVASAAVVTVTPGTATAAPGPVTGQAAAATVTVTPGTATGSARITATASPATITVTPGSAIGLPKITTTAVSALITVTPGTATGSLVTTAAATSAVITVTASAPTQVRQVVQATSAVVTVSATVVTVVGGAPVVTTGPGGDFISARFTRRKARRYPVQQLETFLALGGWIAFDPIVRPVQTVVSGFTLGSAVEIAGSVTRTIEFAFGYTEDCAAERIDAPVIIRRTVTSEDAIALAFDASAVRRNERDELIDDSIDLMELYEATGDHVVLDMLKSLYEDVNG